MLSLCYNLNSLRPLEVDNVARNFSGLLIFAKNGAWKNVVELSEELLKMEEFKAPPSTVNFNIVIRLRLTGLFRLKLFDELSHEVGRALLIEEEYIQKKSQSQVVAIHEKAIALRLLSIEIKIMTGNVGDAMEQLYVLKKFLNTKVIELRDGMDSAAAAEIAQWWCWRVRWSIINGLLRQRLWRQSIVELSDMLHDMPTLFLCEDDSGSRIKFLLHSEIIILCRLSRTLIQVVI